MIDYEGNRETICLGLKKLLGITIVKTNQNKNHPKFPYLSYTITLLKGVNKGTYSIQEDGARTKEVEQTWSFTFNSDNDIESLMLAMKAHDWFQSSIYLKDNEIVVKSITAVTPRDNMISVEYEYKKGFDVTFVLVDTVESEDSFDIISFDNYKTSVFQPNKCLKNADGGKSADRIKDKIEIYKE